MEFWGSQSCEPEISIGQWHSCDPEITPLLAGVAKLEFCGSTAVIQKLHVCWPVWQKCNFVAAPLRARNSNSVGQCGKSVIFCEHSCGILGEPKL